MYSKVKTIVKKAKKNGEKRRTAPAHFSISNLLTRFLRFKLLFFTH